MTSRSGLQAGAPTTNCRLQPRARSDDPTFARRRHGCRAVTDFLDQNNPDAARRASALIWTAIDRLQEFPALGTPTEDADIIIRFSASGYIVRYALLAETRNILVTRIWHGRESRI
jgi:toxin ParE1/3/4